MSEEKKKKKRVKKEIVRSENRLLKGKDRVFLRAMAVCILIGIGVAVGISWIGFLPGKSDISEVEFSEQTGEAKNFQITYEYVNHQSISGIAQAGIRVRDALLARPTEYDLSGEAAERFAELDGVRIEDGAVAVSVHSPGLLKSDDKYYYLFEKKIYEEELPEEAQPVASVYKDTEAVLVTDLNRGSADTRLFSGFQVAIRKNGSYQPVSETSFIENPEALASYNYTGIPHSSKKGLLIDPLKSSTGEWDDLGVDYATYNFPLSHILGATSNGAYPTIGYNYHGKTWYFNGAHIHEYDYLFSIMTKKGIDVTGIILDNASVSAYPEFTHPDARSGSTAPYQMFNGATKDGVEALGAVATFLASRYSGGEHGRVHNWIIGNEVNARKEWNYMSPSTDLAAYTKAYAQAYRVFYNAIKSVNAGAGVYICLDQQWDRNKKNHPDYDARDLLDLFAEQIREQGDIDWGLAYHPYSVPLTQAAFWKSTPLVTQSADSSFITMQNIGVLTNYMHQERFLKKDGSVRSIILSEQGYSSTAGQDLQAAAFAYAYKIAAANPDIDYFIYARETDHSSEIAENLALGLNDLGGGHKRIYQVYREIDQPGGSAAVDFALGIIGISHWP